MERKIAWAVAIMLLGGLGLLLWRVMPGYGCAEWNGRQWQVTASGWPVLWQAWPSALVGVMAGFLGIGGLLSWLWGIVLEKSIEAEKQRLGEKWKTAVAEIENRVKSREEAAFRRESAAFEAQQLAEAATRKAEQARLDAEATQQEARLRIRNAVCAAERIKRKANISALADGPKSARNSPPEPPR